MHIMCLHLRCHLAFFLDGFVTSAAAAGEDERGFEVQ